MKRSEDGSARQLELECEAWGRAQRGCLQSGRGGGRGVDADAIPDNLRVAL